MTTRVTKQSTSVILGPETTLRPIRVTEMFLTAKSFDFATHEDFLVLPGGVTFELTTDGTFRTKIR